MDALKRILGLAQELPNDQDLGAEVRKLLLNTHDSDFVYTKEDLDSAYWQGYGEGGNAAATDIMMSL